MFFSAFLSVLVAPVFVLTYDGTTTFDTILVAHAEPTICPSPTVGLVYAPDSDYVVCCYNGFPSATKTTAKGPGGKAIYACCESGYTCTGAAPIMSDWSVDSNGDVQYLTLASAPTPTSAAAQTTGVQDEAITSLNLGTVSSSGAIPYSTQPNGVVIYNNINNGDGNQNTNSNVSTGGSPALSSGAIAGITIACTIITTIVGILGLRYARRQARRGDAATQGEKLPQAPARVYAPPVPRASSFTMPQTDPSPLAQCYTVGNVPQEVEWNQAYPNQVELDGQARRDY